MAKTSKNNIVDIAYNVYVRGYQLFWYLLQKIHQNSGDQACLGTKRRSINLMKAEVHDFDINIDILDSMISTIICY